MVSKQEFTHAFETLVQADEELFPARLRDLLRAFESHLGHPDLANYFVSPLLDSCFSINLNGSPSFEYEFRGDERLAHRVMCTAILLQVIGWTHLHRYARRWARILHCCLVPKGLSEKGRRDLMTAKVRVAYLFEQLLPHREPNGRGSARQTSNEPTAPVRRGDTPKPQVNLRRRSIPIAGLATGILG